MIQDLISKMYMNRDRANARIEDLLTVHIEALRGDPNSKQVVAALTNAKIDFHNLIGEIYDELDAIVTQDVTDHEVQSTMEDAA